MEKVLPKEALLSVLNSFDKGHENIIKALHALQDAHPLHYISKEILDEVSAYFKLTKAQLFGIVTYYSMFSLKPRRPNLIRLCHSPVCRMMGSQDMLNALNQKIENAGFEDLFTVETVECLGRCGKAPSMMINEEVFTGLTAQGLEEIINAYTHKKA